MTFAESIKEDMRLAEMDLTLKQYFTRCSIPSLLFAINIALLAFFAMKDSPIQWTAVLLLPIFFGIFMFLCAFIPRIRVQRIEKAIEADVFVPARMLVTLLESGSSLVTAFDRVSKTRTVSGQYFGKIASEIYLGKNLDQAVMDAIHNTPSRSFKRVLEPIKNSLRTGAAIERSLLGTINDLTKEKVVEIEKYGTRLAPVSMFYMIFGTVLPTVAVVALIVLFSIAGISITFFPFLLILLLGLIVMQVFFYNIYKSIRPLVKL